MNYAVLSGPVMFQSTVDNAGYMTLMNVSAGPRTICVVRKDASNFKSPSMMWLYGGDRINLEDMNALMKFTQTVVKHGSTVKLIMADALTLAIAIRVGLNSTNDELQKTLSTLRFSLVARTPTDTGVNTMTFDTQLLKTFNPVALAHSTDVYLTISEL